MISFNNSTLNISDKVSVSIPFTGFNIPNYITLRFSYQEIRELYGKKTKIILFYDDQTKHVGKSIDIFDGTSAIYRTGFFNSYKEVESNFSKGYYTELSNNLKTLKILDSPTGNPQEQITGIIGNGTILSLNNDININDEVLVEIPKFFDIYVPLQQLLLNDYYDIALYPSNVTCLFIVYDDTTFNSVELLSVDKLNINMQDILVEHFSVFPLQAPHVLLADYVPLPFEAQNESTHQFGFDIRSRTEDIRSTGIILEFAYNPEPPLFARLEPTISDLGLTIANPPEDEDDTDTTSPPIDLGLNLAEPIIPRGITLEGITYESVYESAHEGLGDSDSSLTDELLGGNNLGEEIFGGGN